MTVSKHIQEVLILLMAVCISIGNSRCLRCRPLQQINYNEIQLDPTSNRHSHNQAKEGVRFKLDDAHNNYITVDPIRNLLELIGGSRHNDNEANIIWFTKCSKNDSTSEICIAGHSETLRLYYDSKWKIFEAMEKSTSIHYPNLHALHITTDENLEKAYIHTKVYKSGQNKKVVVVGASEKKLAIEHGAYTTNEFNFDVTKP